MWVVSFVDLGLWWIGALSCSRFVGLWVLIPKGGFERMVGFGDGGDQWVSNLDLILCFDGLVGLQLGDWC